MQTGASFTGCLDKSSDVGGNLGADPGDTGQVTSLGWPGNALVFPSGAGREFFFFSFFLPPT